MFKVLEKATGLDFQEMGFSGFTIPDSSSMGALYVETGLIALHPSHMTDIPSLRNVLCTNETLQWILDWRTLKPLPQFQKLYDLLFPTEVVFTYRDYVVINVRKGCPLVPQSHTHYNTRVLYYKLDKETNEYCLLDMSDSGFADIDHSTKSLLEVKSGCTVIDKIDIRMRKRIEAEFCIEDGRIVVPESMKKPTFIRVTEKIKQTDEILEVDIHEVSASLDKRSKKHIIQLHGYYSPTAGENDTERQEFHGVVADYDFHEIPHASWMNHFETVLDYKRNPTNRVIWHMLDENDVPKYDGSRLFVDSDDIHWVNYCDVWLPLQKGWLHIPDEDIQNEIQLYNSIL